MRNINAARANATRAKARAKANPGASSEKATTARKRRADLRSVEAKRLRRQGASVAQIVRTLGVSHTTVYNLLDRQYDSPTQQRLV